MQAKINDPKFNKAQTLAAKQKVEDTRAKLAKAIDWVASLLNGWHDVRICYYSI